MELRRACLSVALVTLLLAALMPAAFADTATATATVSEPAPALNPGRGPANTFFRVNLAPDFSSCIDGDVRITWDGNRLSLVQQPQGGPAYAVPGDASVGGHDVVATCTVFSGTLQSDPARFQVAKPALTLGTTHARAGATLGVSGTDFVCSEKVRLSLAAGQQSYVDVDPSGSFATQLTIPPDTPAGDQVVTADCPTNAAATDVKTFTVDPAQTGGSASGGQTSGGASGGSNGGSSGGMSGGSNGGTAGGASGGTSTGGTSGGNGGMVAGVTSGAAVLLAGGAVLLFRRRGPRWARAHVRTELRSAGAGTAALEEHADRERPFGGIRLQAHPDPEGRHTYREEER